MNREDLPSQEAIEHGMDTLITQIIYETEKKPLIDKLGVALRILPRYGYDLRYYKGLYTAFKTNFDDFGGVQ